MSRRRPLPAFDRKTDGPARAFIVGCPRSGTTWMQLLVARHPAVATSQETHLFSRYLRPVMRAWRAEEDLPDDRRRVGLTTVMAWEDFRDACVGFADSVFERVLSDNPDAELIVEKTPQHLLVARDILQIYPRARFIHVIRDPRAVVCSLRAAGRSWGAHWAPTNVADGAAFWKRHVEAGLGIADLTERYHEVRYASLQRDAAAALKEVFDFLGLAADSELCEQAEEACRLERLRQKTAGVSDSPWRLDGEPEGFFRAGRPRGWRAELTREELRRVEYVTAGLLEPLGFEPVTEPSARRPARLALRQGLEWRFDRFERAIRDFMSRI